MGWLDQFAISGDLASQMELNAPMTDEQNKKQNKTKQNRRQQKKRSIRYHSLFTSAVHTSAFVPFQLLIIY
jgi:hypothetical protein